jgi:hypothetical protein
MEMQTTWTEVITVRSNGVNTHLLASTLKDLMRVVDREREDGLKGIRIYQRERIDTDFSIVLFHHPEKATAGPSRLGVRISDALKELGQVHHTVWLEMDPKETDRHRQATSS